jgi:transposase
MFDLWMLACLVKHRPDPLFFFLLRKLLHMPTLSAVTRWNKRLKTFYCHLRDQGKKHSVALTACMRKLIIMLNVMVKNNQVYDPKIC